jgi:hypothetical protein
VEVAALPRPSLLRRVSAAAALAAFRAVLLVILDVRRGRSVGVVR